MDQENKPKEEEIVPITHIDSMRVKKIKRKGENYFALVDEFETYRVKFYNKVPLTKKEGIRFVTLCKYFMEHAASESMKTSCKILYDTYMQGL